MTVHRYLDVELLDRVRGAQSVDEVLEAALEVEIPHGRAAGLRLCDLADDDATVEWIIWAIARPADHWPRAFAEALRIVVAAYYPHLVRDADRRPA